MVKEFVSAKIFIDAVLPNLPILLEYYEPLKNKFNTRNFVLQLRVDDKDCKLAVNFSVKNGAWTCNSGISKVDTDIEFCFNSLQNFNTYIAGVGSPMPKIKGLLKLGLMVDVIALLNKFAYLMQSKIPCENPIDKECQAKILLNILPKAVDIIKIENLDLMINNFSTQINLCIDLNVLTPSYNCKSIVLKYEPTNTNQETEAQKLKFDFPNFDSVTAFCLLNKDQATEKINTTMAVEYMKYFVKIVNEFCRLNYRN